MFQFSVEEYIKYVNLYMHVNEFSGLDKFRKKV